MSIIADVQNLINSLENATKDELVETRKHLQSRGNCHSENAEKRVLYRAATRLIAQQIKQY